MDGHAGWVTDLHPAQTMRWDATQGRWVPIPPLRDLPSTPTERE